MSQLKMLQLESIAIYIFIRKEWFERFVEINTEIRIWFVILESSQSSHSIIGFLSFWGIPEWSSAEFFSIFFHFDSTRKARQMNDSAEFAHFLLNSFFLNFYALENSSNQKTISHLRLTFLLLSVSTWIWPRAFFSKLKRRTHSSHFLR